MGAEKFLATLFKLEKKKKMKMLMFDHLVRSWKVGQDESFSVPPKRCTLHKDRDTLLRM